MDVNINNTDIHNQQQLEELITKVLKLLIKYKFLTMTSELLYRSIMKLQEEWFSVEEEYLFLLS